MELKLKYFAEHKLCILKFHGNMDIHQFIDALILLYETPEYKKVDYSILDLRESDFHVVLGELRDAIEVIMNYNELSFRVASAILVTKPKETALSEIFRMYLKVCGKLFSINSTSAGIVFSLKIPLSKVQLDKLIASV